MPSAIHRRCFTCTVSRLSTGCLFGEIWTPSAVISELAEGQQRGYDVPEPKRYTWLREVNPQATPSEWLSLDLGPGELAAMALSLENPTRIILLDDQLARRTAQAAGLNVWGTLKVLLEAKAQGLTASIEPFVTRLSGAGMWLSADVRQRILVQQVRHLNSWGVVSSAEE